MSRYLISKTADPLFALFIGATAAWTRIRREELQRFHEQFNLPSDAAQSTTPQPTLSPSSAEITAKSGSDVVPSPSPPTASDTLRTFGRRIGDVKWNPKDWEFEWKDLWKRKDTWGIVNPNER